VIRVRANESAAPPGFASALRSSPGVAVIGEIKRGSPSRGVMDAALDARTRALELVAAGASAISVLTEPADFGGRNEDIRAVRAAVDCPVLRKDFLVHPLQVWESRALGASAALLIARALGPEETRFLADAAREAGVEPLVEVRDESELEWALDAGAVLIGVNRRNLETLAMETEVLERLLPRIPAGCVAIAESGITSRADVESVARLGADAVLVGSLFSTSPDAARDARALIGVERQGRR
jgi:indole-3-glycerol phosphate synthase